MRSLEVALTAQGRAVLARYRAQSLAAHAMLLRALRKVTALFLRESQKAFSAHRQTGGGIWAANRGRYAEYKAALGFSGAGQGTVTGETRRSLAYEVDAGNLVSRVGSNLAKAKKLAEGGPYPAFSAEDHSGKVWFFRAAQTSPRPFLPARDWASTRAARMVRAEIAKFTVAMNGGGRAGGLAARSGA